MYDPEQIDALIVERDRLRVTADELETECTEWEAIVGMHLAQAIAEAHARRAAGHPYALADYVAELVNARRAGAR
jgi:hypothetical protein